ncbi:sugar transferase [Saccharomonospora piscinae]|uniref:Sugar transferase n=1 Tax=Saccharomonospora piscinae TaxID=687388 RepID=A0A1V9A1Y3_SACPI|nr:GtrA family protein [Saccharomonospora piscinae]OQO91139.1 sugar transferase [Saccharomonospora piscinae]TLW93837.1 GtrA family protein [Saccharomonospora piscinae]
MRGRLVRFAAVGAVNTATYVGLYLLLRPTMGYLAAHVVAFVLAMVGSYFLNCRFTFRTRPSLRTFLLFPLSNVTNFAVTSAGLYLLVEVFAVNERIAPLLAAAVAIPVTFLVAQSILTQRRTRPTVDGREPEVRS